MYLQKGSRNDFLQSSHSGDTDSHVCVPQVVQLRIGFISQVRILETPSEQSYYLSRLTSSEQSQWAHDSHISMAGYNERG